MSENPSELLQVVMRLLEMDESKRKEQTQMFLEVARIATNYLAVLTQTFHKPSPETPKTASKKPPPVRII